MSKQNFKSQAKRKRELAKLDKRTAKDQKRAAKKAENSVDVVAVAAPVGSVQPALAPKPPFPGLRPAAVVPPKVPLTLAEMALRWKNTKIVKPKTR